MVLALTFVTVVTLAGCGEPIQRPQVIIQQPARKAVPSRPAKPSEIEHDRKLGTVQDEVRGLRDKLKVLDSLREKEYAR
jgi:hypothetical protein